MLNDVKYALEKRVDHKLWMQFYKQIERLTSQLSRAPASAAERAEAVSHLRVLLDASADFFTALAAKVDRCCIEGALRFPPLLLA